MDFTVDCKSGEVGEARKKSGRFASISRLIGRGFRSFISLIRAIHKHLAHEEFSMADQDVG